MVNLIITTVLLPVIEQSVIVVNDHSICIVNTCSLAGANVRMRLQFVRNVYIMHSSVTAFDQNMKYFDMVRMFEKQPLIAIIS